MAGVGRFEHCERRVSSTPGVAFPALNALVVPLAVNSPRRQVLGVVKPAVP